MATATNRVSKNGKAPKNEAEGQVVPLYELQTQTIEVPVVELSPLLMHKFSEKAKKAIEDKQQQKAAKAREAKDPEAEFRGAMYLMPGAAADSDHPDVGFPASGFKNAIVSACRFVDGIPMTRVRGALFILADAAGLVRINYGEVRMREDAVRVGGKGKGTGTLDLRYRPEFLDWSATLRVQYNAAVISPEQIVNLINIAGFSIGIGDYRPERDGENGRFTVKR